MRHLSRTVLVRILALSIAAAACTSATAPTTTTLAASTSSTTTTTAPTTTLPPTTTTTIVDPRGGAFAIGIDREPTTLNPLLTDDPVVALIAQAWTVGVAEVSGATGTLVPELVTELPTVANGGVVVNENGTMTVTYTIREEAVWADGTPITGADFQFTLDTILDPGVSVSKDIYADILSSTVGEKVFSYTLAFPTMEFEGLFNVVLPSNAMIGADFGVEWNDRTWMSGGPYRLANWTAGESLTFERNPAYWKVDPDTGLALPFADTVTFQIIAEPGDRLSAIAAGSVDALAVDDDLAAAEQYSTLGPLGVTVVTVPGPVWIHLNFQFGEGRWDRNPDSLNEYLTFRQAVMHAIDRQAIATALYGDRAVALDSYVTLYDPTLTEGPWSRYGFDPEEAGRLAAQATTDRTTADPDASDAIILFFTTNADNEDRSAVAGLIGEMLETAGIAYQDTSEDSITFFGETIGRGRFDVAMWAWQANMDVASLIAFHDVLDPDDDRSLTNFYRWGTPTSGSDEDVVAAYRDLLEAARETVDRDQLALIIQELEMLIANQALLLPLYAEPESVAHRSVSGFELVTAVPFTWNLEYWEPAP